MPGIYARAGCEPSWLIALAFSFVSKPACHHFVFLNLLMFKTRTRGKLAT